MISDEFCGIPWRYTDAKGLIEILCEKVENGFTFPLNPKWILCDNGWKRVYDKLRASKKANVRDSLNIWYPKEIREKIEDISAKYPQGFVDTGAFSARSSQIRADLAELELKRYVVRLLIFRVMLNAFDLI